jgi:hypothetical protein
LAVRYLGSLTLILALAAVAACGPTAPVTPGASPSVVPSAGVSAAPSTPAASPAASPSAVATAAPSATPSVAGFAWKPGTLLKAYDFKGIAGIYYDGPEASYYVVDAVNDDQTPRRYLVRKFNQTGAFQASFKLAPTGKLDPRAVDGVAFDRRGIPFFTYSDFDKDVYRNDSTDRTWLLLKLVTAAVLPADRLPSNSLPRAGVSTLASSGDLFTLGVLRLDPDKDVTGNRKVSYVQGEEDQSPVAIASFDDPFEPTTLMASSPTGTVYLTGPLKAGGFSIKKIGTDQKLVDFASVTELPKGMWAGPNGEVYTASTTTSKAATVRKYSPDGALLGETEARLADGGYLLHVAGMTFDPAGHPVVTGDGFDVNKQSMSGIFVFTE